MARTKTIHYCENRLQAYCKLRFKGPHKMPALEAWRASAKFDKIERWFGDRPSGVRAPDSNGFRGGKPFNSAGSTLTWCECPGEYLECAGVYGDSRRHRHTGWYLDEDGMGELARGIVYKIRAPRTDHRTRGCTRQFFIAGIKDPYNDGPAMLQLSRKDWHVDLDEAFRDADSMAAAYAEREREYQAAWSRGNEVNDLKDEAATLREEAKALVKELNLIKRQVKLMGGDQLVNVTASVPVICSTLRGQIKSAIAAAKQCLEKAEKITDEWGSQEGFKNALADG